MQVHFTVCCISKSQAQWDFCFRAIGNNGPQWRNIYKGRMRQQRVYVMFKVRFITAFSVWCDWSDIFRQVFPAGQVRDSSWWSLIKMSRDFHMNTRILFEMGTGLRITRQTNKSLVHTEIQLQHRTFLQTAYPQTLQCIAYSCEIVDRRRITRFCREPSQRTDHCIPEGSFRKTSWNTFKERIDIGDMPKPLWTSAKSFAKFKLENLQSLKLYNYGIIRSLDQRRTLFKGEMASWKRLPWRNARHRCQTEAARLTPSIHLFDETIARWYNAKNHQQCDVTA